MATHYHARDRTVLKNSRDGLQKENLHTKEAVSVSKKEKELLLNTAGERMDLSSGYTGMVSGTSNRKPPIHFEEADGRGSENAEDVPTGVNLRETTSFEPTTQFSDDTFFKGDDGSFGAFQEDPRSTKLLFSTEKHNLRRDDYMGRMVKRGFEGVEHREDHVTDGNLNKNSTNVDPETSESFWREDLSIRDTNEKPARKKSIRKKTQDLYSSFHPEADSHYQQIRHTESEEIQPDLHNEGEIIKSFDDAMEEKAQLKWDDEDADIIHPLIHNEKDSGRNLSCQKKVRYRKRSHFDNPREGNSYWKIVDAENPGKRFWFEGTENARVSFQVADTEERSSHSQSVEFDEGTERNQFAYETDTGNHHPIDGEDEKHLRSVKSEDSKDVPKPESATYSSRLSRQRNQHYGKPYSQHQTRCQIWNNAKIQSKNQSQNRNKTGSSSRTQDKLHPRFKNLSFFDEKGSIGSGITCKGFNRRYMEEKIEETISNAGNDHEDVSSDVDDISKELVADGLDTARSVALWLEKEAGDQFVGSYARGRLRFGQPKDAVKETSMQAARGLQRTIQKKRYQREYQQAKRAGRLFESGIAQCAGGKAARQSAKGAAKEAIKAVIGGKKSVAAAIAFFILVIVMVMSTFSGCVAVMGGMASILSTTFPGTDEDIQGVDAAYTALEEKLDDQINEMETTHPNYDEYRYQVDEITHNPFQLASILSSKFGNYTLDDVQDELPIILNLQYTLNVTEEVETRTRTVTDPETGEETEEEYDYYILNIELTNHGLDYAAGECMTDDQKLLYETYNATHGNRDDLFDEDAITASPGGGAAGGIAYEIPPEALSDERFKNMISEAEKYLGYPYVWGGSNPSTSFDCSGFVAWVVNNCGNGWSIGRPTAEGIRQICSPVESGDARPGDLIFFQGTYDTPGASHIGIYVGNGMMIHCGKPVQYTNINTSYWQQHFFMFGRLS